MTFYGQDNIVKELSLIKKSILEGNNYSLLFIGPSGYGKTTLALKFFNLLGKMDFEMVNPNNPRFSEDLRFHIWDEVHILENQELVYPIIDSGKYTMIFITNEYDSVKEPLLNRCIPFVFHPYTPSEILQIVTDRLSEFHLNPDELRYLATCTDGIPRKVKILTDRLRYIFTNLGKPNNLQELESLCNQILSLDERGLDRLQREYLDYLNSCGKSSIDRISYALRIPKSIILRDIEPGLLYRNLIDISSKGRSIR
jgi:Holliday junction resolvasome RuvABC ATP-dependent DNA helicase subunit